MAATLTSTGTGAQSSPVSSSKPAEARDAAPQKTKLQLLMQKIALQRALAVAAEYWSEKVEVSDGETAKHSGEPEHVLEMRTALLGACAWQEAVFGTAPRLEPVDGLSVLDDDEAKRPQQPADKQSLRGPGFAPPDDSDCAIASEDGKSGASTAEGVCSGSSSESEDETQASTRSCWVYGAQLKDVKELLDSGIAAPAHTHFGSKRNSKSPKLFSGPWGRTGVGCIGAEALVYVDISAARVAGAKLRLCKGGLELGSTGSGIPASCIRKIVRILDCEELFLRQVRAPLPAHKPAETLGVPVADGRSPLAALLRSMES